MEHERNTDSGEALDVILGRDESSAAADATTAAENIFPSNDELKTQKNVTKAEKRKTKTGVPFVWALIVVIMTNLAWMGYIQFVNTPRWESVVDGYQIALEQKDDEIRRIQVIYQEREKDFEKRLTEAEEKYAELNERLDKAIEKYNKYFGKEDPVE